MPTTAEKCVKACIQRIQKTFDGFGEDVVEEFYRILIDEVRQYGEAVCKEAMAAVATGAVAAGEPEKPRLRRVNNYTLFGSDFREKHPEIKEDMFKRISEAWKELSEDAKTEWREKADAENTRLREEYVSQHGEPPKHKKKKNRAKTTNPFQEYVKEFRQKNPKVGHKDVFREASKAWKKLSDKQKQKYLDSAKELREEYLAAWEEEQKNNPPVPDMLEMAAAALNGKTAKRKQQPRPKTRSGYILFGNHWRAEMNKENLSGKNAMSALAAAWKDLSEKEKTKFNKKADAENEKIVAAFVKENPEAEWTRKHQTEQTA